MRNFAILLLTLLVTTIAAGAQAQSRAKPPLYGITPFPYDYSLEALQTVSRLLRDNTTMNAIHLDNGIPWQEMLDGKPIPASILKEWTETKGRLAADLPVYVGIAPLDTDRKSLAPALGEKWRLPLPAELHNAALDDPKVIAAYLRYVRLVIDVFRPDYLNIGIEAGEIMSRDASLWPHFVKLYTAVYDAAKQDHPNIKIGISFGLGELRSPAEAITAKLILEKCDYVGLSFYPYASGFDEKFGAPAYGGNTPWREPLAWIRKYTNKPIAICETGYSTQNINIPQFNLSLKGDPAKQAEYVRELFRTASSDHYLFVVWYLAVDYDKLYAKMPFGSDAMLLWKNIGLLDSDLKPKPAWKTWQAGVHGVGR